MNNKKQRELSYKVHTTISYEGKFITVDTANKLYIAYIAEGDIIKASEISELIIDAKTRIREQFPDFSPEV